MIPNIIHQIWIQGRDKIPNELQDHYRSCREINKNFRHILWDERKIRFAQQPSAIYYYCSDMDHLITLNDPTEGC